MACLIIYLCLIVMALTIALVKHGEYKGKYNFFVELIAAAIQLLLLWGMGVFNLFHA